MPTNDEIRRRFIAQLQSGKSTAEATAAACRPHVPQRAPGTLPPPPVAKSDALTLARQEYTAATGKKPYHGWDYDELMRRIREAGEA